jgi:hypothetical protein
MKLILFTTLLAFASAQAADKNSPKPTWIDPEKAAKEDPDFSIQGEYYKKGVPFAAQVVALGDHKFTAYILGDGLPGLGWNKQKTREAYELIPEADGFVSTKKEPFLITLQKGILTIKIDEDFTYSLPRIERESPTLGAKAPEGATVLFDGTSVEHWQNGKMQNGLLQATGTTSKPTFKSYKLHLEFRPPYKPFARGQGRGNSGVYFGGRWETQILDSFGLDGKMNECGGIYSIAEPRLNMCLPPLKWQTYDVDFTAAKFDAEGKMTDWPSMTVKLNGVLIHKNQKLNKDFTTASPKNGPLKDEARPVFLQSHGNPVVFQNIWVLPK